MLQGEIGGWLILTSYVKTVTGNLIFRVVALHIFGLNIQVFHTYLTLKVMALSTLVAPVKDTLEFVQVVFGLLTENRRNINLENSPVKRPGCLH